MIDSCHPDSIALIDQVHRFWKDLKYDINPGASIEQVEAFESHYSVRLPPDLRKFYATVDGMREWMCDDGLNSWLMLGLVKSVPEDLAHFKGVPDYRDITQTLPDAHRWFVIVNYSITCAVYAIRLSGNNEETPVRWIGSGRQHQVVAASFTEFLERYLDEPYRQIL